MEAVVLEGGTGIKAGLEGFRIAGKTGTAQIVDPHTKAYSRSRYISSFIGFPVGTETKVVVFTALDYPKGVYYASETAAPLFKEILEAVVTRMGMPATETLLAKTVKPSPSLVTDRVKWSLAKMAQSEKGLEWEATLDGKNSWKMPELRGLSVREAFKILSGHSFQIQIQNPNGHKFSDSAFGLIRTQRPELGSKLVEGQVIKIGLE
jgi:cell division protein FtsI (penicillin-binding protein 3)